MGLTYSWNTIDASQTDADSPLDQTLMDSIRENIMTLYESIVGAPYTSPPYTITDAHNHDGVNSALITSVADGSITNAKLSNVSAGSSIFLVHSKSITNTSYQTWQVLTQFWVMRSGTYRVRFKAWGSDYITGPPYSQWRIRLNGNTIASGNITWTSPTWISRDITLSYGSNIIIELYFASTDNGANGSSPMLLTAGSTGVQCGIEQAYY